MAVSDFLQTGSLAWVRASVADVRREPSHAAEQVTQALQGEVCQPQVHRDGWLQVGLADGYVGWIRDWHLVAVDASQVSMFLEQANARLRVPWAVLRSHADASAPPVAETVMGTRLIVDEPQSGWLRTQLPTGLHGWLREEAVRPGSADWPAVLDSILPMFASFLGVPYVWGGRSPKGFDCSGLMQFVLGLHGIALQRDSADQFASTPGVSGAPLPGDLLFFGEPRVSHVAVQFDAQRYLHARGVVRFNSLDPGHELYDAALARQFRGRTRVLPQSLPVDGVS